MGLQNLLGFFLPPVIDIINNRIADTRVRYLVSMAICLLIGIILNLDKLGNVDALLENISIVFITAQTTYNLYWKNSDARDSLKTSLAT
jgi:hypothetical protein